MKGTRQPMGLATVNVLTAWLRSIATWTASDSAGSEKRGEIRAFGCVLWNKNK
jgi:hypothetical protein